MPESTPENDIFMITSSSVASESLAKSALLRLTWLIRLRWIALMGQLGIMGLIYFLGMNLPVLPLLALVIAGAFLNVMLESLKNRVLSLDARLFASVLVTDILLLTAMLFYTGGPHNPFTSIYFLHITVASLMLSPRWIGGILVLCALGFGSLFFFSKPLHSEHIHDGGMSFDLHLHGMLLAFVLTGSCLCYFVLRLRQGLDRAESALMESRLQATRNERFTSLATLAAGVAHELATPLGTIALVSAELTRESRLSGLSKDQRTDLQLIRSEVERCRGILNGLGQRSTGGVGDPGGWQKSSELLKAIQDKLSAVQASRLTVVDDLQGRQIFMPMESLAQALVALIRNAWDAQPQQASILLQFFEDDQFYKFKVSDHGPGMSPDILAKLGEPFFSTKPQAVGMGLGLFLVRCLMEQLKGHFDVQSKEGEGTQIILSLPRNLETAPS